MIFQIIIQIVTRIRYFVGIALIKKINTKNIIDSNIFMPKKILFSFLFLFFRLNIKSPRL